MKVIYQKFNSVGALSSWLARGQVQPAFQDSPTSFRVGSGFSGVETYEQADNLLLYGDADLRRKIEAAGVAKMRARLRHTAPRRVLYSAVVGCAPNVPAFVCGSPNSMINVRAVRVPQRVITFAYNCSVGGAVPAESIIQNAANVVAAIMLIESAGVRVNLYTAEVTKHYADKVARFAWLCKIKESGQKLDVLKMAYPLAHAAMLRRQGFRVMEMKKGVPEKYAGEGGYGTPITNENESLKTLQAAGVRDLSRVLCYYDIQGKTPEEIAGMILNEKL